MKERLIRTFVAINAPNNAKNVKQMLISTMDQDKAEIRWVKHSNLHLTVKFLGFTPENDISSLSNDLDAIAKANSPFDLSVSGTGCFPSESKPSVLFLGISGKINALSKLVKDTEVLMTERGYPKLESDYFPHITIARIKYPQKFSPDISSFLNSSYDSIDFRVNHLQFFSSEILPEGVFYNLLGTFPLVDI
jgi:2''-5'' RNA ligase